MTVTAAPPVGPPTDLTAPGAVDTLLSWHRSVFGNTLMTVATSTSASDGDGGDTSSDDSSDDSGQSESTRNERQGDPASLSEAGRRAIAAERRTAAAEKRRADTAEARIAELERAQMTEQDRVAAERDDWRKKYEEQTAELAARDLDLLRRDVAAEKGLPALMARRLQGDARETLEADADDLVAQLAAAAPAAGGPTAPRPDPSAGSTGDSGRPTSIADAMRLYREAQNAKTGPRA